MRFGCRKRQPAFTKTKLTQLVEGGLPGFEGAVQSFLFDNVESGDAEVADVLAHETGNIVVAHEQEIDGHVLAVAEQLVLALADLEAASFEQLHRLLGEAA